MRDLGRLTLFYTYYLIWLFILCVWFPTAVGGWPLPLPHSPYYTFYTLPQLLPALYLVPHVPPLHEFPLPLLASGYLPIFTYNSPVDPSQTGTRLHTLHYTLLTFVVRWFMFWLLTSHLDRTLPPYWWWFPGFPQCSSLPPPHVPTWFPGWFPLPSFDSPRWTCLVIVLTPTCLRYSLRLLITPIWLFFQLGWLIPRFGFPGTPHIYCLVVLHALIRFPARYPTTTLPLRDLLFPVWFVIYLPGTVGPLRQTPSPAHTQEGGTELGLDETTPTPTPIVPHSPSPHADPVTPTVQTWCPPPVPLVIPFTFLPRPQAVIIQLFPIILHTDPHPTWQWPDPWRFFGYLHTHGWWLLCPTGQGVTPLQPDIPIPRHPLLSNLVPYLIGTPYLPPPPYVPWPATLLQFGTPQTGPTHPDLPFPSQFSLPKPPADYLPTVGRARPHILTDPHIY